MNEGNGVEVLSTKLDYILDALRILREDNNTRDIRIAKLEAWMNRRDSEIEMSQDRFRMIEGQLDEHQKFIDIDSGKTMGKGDLLTRIALILGMIASLYGIYFKLH